MLILFAGRVNRGKRVLTLAEQTEKIALLALCASETGNLRHIGAGCECFRPLANDDYTRPPHPGTPF